MLRSRERDTPAYGREQCCFAWKAAIRREMLRAMSEENIEIVRRMYDAFYSGDVDGALSHFAPDVLVDASKARPDVGVGKGREHVSAIVTSWVASWEDWREEIEEMRDLGSAVLVERSAGPGQGKRR